MVVFHHHKSGVAALNVVGAALTVAADTRAVPVVYARTLDDVVAAAVPGTIVGFSFYSTDAHAAYAARAEVAARAPGVLTLAGGVHASARPEEVLDAGFDAVAIGEGEGTMVALVRAVRDGQALESVPGLALRRGGVTVHTGAAERAPLGTYPAFHAPLRKFNPVEITRGCVYACRFCQTPYVFKARFRHRPVDDVAAHAAALRAAGLDYLRFVTPTALSYGSTDETCALAEVDGLLRAVREAFGRGRIYFGTFPSEVRPEHVTRDALDVLARWVDHRTLIVGGQSGSDRVLEATRRGHTVADIVRAVETCIAAGWTPDVDLLLGLPDETPADQRATAALAEHLARLGARLHTHAFLPLPGTPLQGATPSPIADDVAAVIARLESAGRGYGQWRRQVEDARRLAGAPAPGRPRPTPAESG